MDATASTLKSDYPWIQFPLIISAAMYPMSCPSLALAVSKAGGLGFITGGLNAADLKKNLEQSAELIHQVQPPMSFENGTLPIGVGFLLFGNKLDEVVPLVQEHKPAAVWLFAAHQIAEYATWAKAMREATDGKTKIWVQVGTSVDALEVAKICEPDALVVQGADAGGHGLQRSAGLMSLFPEVSDSLKADGLGHIQLFAAGGIAEGRGTLAALALGANGVVMGTRFLAAKEALIPTGYQDAVVRVKSGATATVRAGLFDNLRGPNIWPKGYDGRGIVNETYVDAEAGMPLDENSRLYAEALDGRLQQYPESGQSATGTGRLTMWAGSGVGLVDRVMPAAEIVEHTRREVKEMVGRLGSKCLE
ncbi:hypothetical protein GJ744_005237 [Endocarpon pusillum]|uniref:Nitronate monooxygenase domain-containing protein n=1 Tax=Endocarpon pusillum TaxID=364733 RepID=A0A8H7A4Z4_9EURO|nr:hypothetical protein GJ744_005237 [Endocarpon pusillum]